MSHFLRQIMDSYRYAFIFIVAAFPLACIPMIFEGLQHIAEVKLGMFTVPVSENFNQSDQEIRIIFGIAKTISILCGLIFLPRYFIYERDMKLALQFTKSARRSCYIGIVIMIAVMLWVLVFGPKFVLFFAPEAPRKNQVLIPLLGFVLLMALLHKHINAWMANVFDDLPLEDHENKIMNKSMMGGFSPIIILGVLPMMVLHYILNAVSIGQPIYGLWIWLTLDSLVVGILAALMGSTYYVIYKYARAGV